MIRQPVHGDDKQELYQTSKAWQHNVFQGTLLLMVT